MKFFTFCSSLLAATQLSEHAFAVNLETSNQISADAFNDGADWLAQISQITSTDEYETITDGTGCKGKAGA